jgi:hypothetical protein
VHQFSLHRLRFRYSQRFFVPALFFSFLCAFPLVWAILTSHASFYTHQVSEWILWCLQHSPKCDIQQTLFIQAAFEKMTNNAKKESMAVIIDKENLAIRAWPSFSANLFYTNPGKHRAIVSERQWVACGFRGNKVSSVLPVSSDEPNQPDE